MNCDTANYRNKIKEKREEEEKRELACLLLLRDLRQGWGTPWVQCLMVQSQAFGDRVHLLFQTGKLLQVSEPLFLVHAGMQSQRHDVQDLEEPREAFDAGDAVGKHQAAAWVLHEEIVEIQVFLICLTVDLGLCQGLHCTLIPREVNNFWLAPQANLLHEKVKFGGFIYFLHMLLMKDSSRSLVYQG